MTKTFLIQIPITFIEKNQNISIEFEDISENYGKKIKVSVSEKKSLRSNPKSWDYYHMLQEINLVEFTNLKTGHYFVSVKSIDDEFIENPLKISITNKSFHMNQITRVEQQKINLTITNINNTSGDQMDNREILKYRRSGGQGVGFLSTQGSFALTGGSGGP